MTEKQKYVPSDQEFECLLCHKITVIFCEEEPKGNKKADFACEDCSREPYEDQKKFGRFMYLLRKEYGWSRKHLAKRLGYSSESSVMNIETGETIMKDKHKSRFCKITPNKLTVALLHAMFEASTINPPCRCVCHHDMNNALKNIYDENNRCTLCSHDESDCTILNGHWFENNTRVSFDCGEPGENDNGLKIVA